MTVPQTAANTDSYVSQFNAYAANGASAAPRWLKQLRDEAIQSFADLGFPTTRQERWRFTSLKGLVEQQFSLPKGGTKPPAGVLDHVLLPNAGPRLVFVDGSFVEDLSTIPALPAGVRIASLASALRGDEDVVREHLARGAPPDENPFAALNTAFACDGGFVYVPTGQVVEHPIQVVFVSTADGEPLMSHPRNLFVLERGAEATFVESYIGVGGRAYLTNAVTEVVVGDGARGDCYRIQREGELAYHIATSNSRLGRDSRYSLTPVVFGAALSRHDILMSLQGEGGHGTLNGLYVMRGRQHVDHNTVIEHAVPNCDSHEYFNGILDDNSRAVFNGRIIVRPDAQKTDSKQTNNNLLLSEAARADSQPQLEIYADDVRCTHGATLGPLDESAIFYLQSRGLSAKAARALLTYGFGVEILARIGIPELREKMEGLVKERLGSGSEGGSAA